MYKELNDNEIIYMIQENEDYVEMMMTKYKPFLMNFCKKYQRQGKEVGYELEDLLQVANLGLIEAIQTYRETKNVLFYTYLSHCVDNKLKTELRNQQTGKKMLLNKAISYDELIPGTDLFILETLPDKSLLTPFDCLVQEEMEIEYIKFLNSLPFEVALVYELKNNGFSTQEISKFLEIDTKIISRCLNIARQKRTV